MLVVLKVINLRCLRKLVSVVTLFRSGSGLRCHKVISPLRPSWPPGFGGSEKIKKKKIRGTSHKKPNLGSGHPCLCETLPGLWPTPPSDIITNGADASGYA